MRFEPVNASRKDVGAAVEAACGGAPRAPGGAAPRLLVCQRGVAIVVVPAALGGATRAALDSRGGQAPVRLKPVVSSGTIAAVKRRMRVTTHKGDRTA